MAEPLTIGPFPMGVNLDTSEGDLEPGELSLSLNLRLDAKGFPYKRPGWGAYGDPATTAKVNGDSPVNFLHRFYKADGSKELVAAAGGKLKKGNDSTGVWSDINIDGVPSNTMEAVLLVDSMTYKDRLYLADGTKPQRYNGTVNVYAGHHLHVAPTTTPTTGGNLTPSSTYKYFVTSVAGDMGEGPAGAIATQALGAGENQINLTAIDDADAADEPTAKNIYRTQANGALYYFVAQIPHGTTTYNDTLADSELGDEFTPTQIPPADSRFVIVGHDERTYWFGMSAGDASLVRVSDIGFPDRITDFFTVANNDGDILTGGAKVPTGLVFFKRRSMWLQRSFGFSILNLSPNLGCVAPFSIAEVPGGIIFLSQGGDIYYFDGTNLNNIGANRVSSQFKELSLAAMERVVATFHNNRYIISYDYRSQKGYNFRHLEFDLRTGRWEGPHENGNNLCASYFAPWDDQLDDDELTWGEARAAAGSYVRKRTEFTKLDGTSDINTRLKTGQRLVPGRGDTVFYKAFVKAIMSSGASLTALMYLDDGVNTVSASLEGTGGDIGNPLIWGSSNWGEANWAGMVFNALEGPFVPKGRATHPMLEISDGGSARELKIEEIQVLARAFRLR